MIIVTSVVLRTQWVSAVFAHQWAYSFATHEVLNCTESLQEKNELQQAQKQIFLNVKHYCFILQCIIQIRSNIYPQSNRMRTEKIDCCDRCSSRWTTGWRGRASHRWPCFCTKLLFPPPKKKSNNRILFLPLQNAFNITVMPPPLMSINDVTVASL